MRTPPYRLRFAPGTRQVLFLFAFREYSVIMNEEHFFSKHDRRTSSTFDTGICRKQTAGGNGRWAGGAIVKNIPNNALAYTFGNATLLLLFVLSRSMS